MTSRRLPALLVCLFRTSPAVAAPKEPLRGLVAKEQPAVVETLRQLVSIESGSRDKTGLDKISALLGDRLRAGFGFHSSDEEYIQLDSIESRLYLLSRLVAELSKAQ